MKIYMVGADEITQCDISLVSQAILESLKGFAESRSLTPVNFGISAYDADPRALFDIPEVRKWAAKLYASFPFIFSLVTLDSLHWLFLAVADITVIERTATQTKCEFKPGAKEKLITDMLDAQNVLFQKLASTQQEFDQLSEQAHRRMLSALRG